MTGQPKSGKSSLRWQQNTDVATSGVFLPATSLTELATSAATFIARWFSRKAWSLTPTTSILREESLSTAENTTSGESE